MSGGQVRVREQDGDGIRSQFYFGLRIAPLIIRPDFQWPAIWVRLKLTSAVSDEDEEDP